MTDTIRAICRVTMLGGLAVAILGVVMPALTRHWEPGSVVWPLMIAIGTALAVYGRHVSRQGRERARPRNAIARPHDVLEAVLVGIVIAAALFWAVQGYADIVGRGYAQRYEDSVSSLPRATAVSKARWVSTLPWYVPSRSPPAPKRCTAPPAYGCWPNPGQTVPDDRGLDHPRRQHHRAGRERFGALAVLALTSSRRRRCRCGRRRRGRGRRGRGRR